MEKKSSFAGRYMDGLTTRLVTAMVFVGVMLGGIFGGLIPYAILFTLLLGLCLWEYLGLVLGEDHRLFPLRSLAGMLMGLLPHVVLIAHRAHWLVLTDQQIYLLLILYLLGLFSLFVLELFSRSREPFRNLAFVLMGIVYIGLPFSLLNFLSIHTGTYDHTYVLGIVLLTWTNDTAAYMIGSRFGRRKLFPRISPKKTWEGSNGGALLTLIVGWALHAIFPQFPLFGWLGLSLIVIVFGSIGDLVESMLKRSIEVKDSGSLLPGHGGLLDRFDSFIFCLPFAVAYVLLLQGGIHF